jgi:hypothetical protein
VDLPDPPARSGAERHPCGVHRDPLEPRVKAISLPKLGELAPRRDERLLGGVSGICLVSEDREGQSVHRIHPGTNDRLERVEVTEASPVDERRVGRGCDRSPPSAFD